MTLEAISALNDEKARLMLAKMRWGSEDQQVCPDCGVVDKHHNIRTRKQWRCKHCFFTFSVTTGTPFADQKIGYRKLLIAIFAFIINQKGLAALTLRRIIGGQYRTSFTLLHKMREAIMITVPTDLLKGEIEIDGGHFSGKVRKGRKKKKVDAKDKSEVPAKYRQHRDKIKASAYPFHPNRRIVIAIREISSKGLGATRTIVAICRSENATDIEALITKYVEKNTVVKSDELTAYGNLKYMGYTHQTVNHSKEFSTDDGVNQNQAESYFSRLRRSCIGIYHRITPKYMLDYANEMAWREDVRQKNTEMQLQMIVRRAFGAGISKDWFNYCRGNKRKAEILFTA